MPSIGPRLRFLLKHSALCRRLFLPRLIRAHYLACHGHPLDLDAPQTFSEKLNWLKALGPVEKLAPFADKYSVRRYVAEVAGDHVLPTLLAAGGPADSLDWDALPRAFVVKATHASGWNIVVRDKAAADPAVITARLRRWLGLSYFINTLEAQYARIPPRFIVESYLGDPAIDPVDYKFHCFSGEPRAIQTDCNRSTSGHTRTLYDPDWNRLPVRWGIDPHPRDLPRPSCLTDMIALARRLAAPFPYVRVDLYQINDRVYFGELTFVPGNGMSCIAPAAFNRQLGGFFDLSAFSRPLKISPRYLRFA